MKQETEKDFIATHAFPAWEQKADFLFWCRIESEEQRNEWEVLRVKEIAEHQFQICCIPFFLYGISLGDKISVKDDFIVEILEKSGNATVRIYTGDADPDIAETYISRLLDASDNAEQHSNSLIAFSVSKEGYPILLSILEEAERDANINFEIASGYFSAD